MQDVAYSEIAYSTATGTNPGWDAFDRAVTWALRQRPQGQTVDDIAQLLPAGISYHLIRTALEVAVADGVAIRVVTLDGEPRYEPTHTTMTPRPGYLAAA